MADINISKFTTQVLRVGSTPSSPGFAVDEGQDPVDPSGNPQTHLPVTIAAAADALSITDAQVLSGAGTTAEYIRGDGTLASFPSLTGYVPYTGATADVDLGTHDLTAERGTFANNGSSDTLTVNHTSGSGYGIIVTKGGNNEALYVSKTSGSGNAMAVVGGRTSLVDLSLSSVSNATGNFLTISGGVVHQRTASEVRTDIGAGTVTSVAALTLGTSGTDLSSTVANGTTTPVITLNVPTASATNRGALSSADWTTFNSKIGGTLATGQVAFGTAANTIGGDSGFFWDNTNKRLGVGINAPTAKLHVRNLVSNSEYAIFSTSSDATRDLSFSSFAVGSTNSVGHLINALSSAGALAFGVNGERWRILSTGILQSNGAQTIQTSTGNLTLATAAGNGNIVLSPNGTGNVLINTTTNAGFRLDVNGTARVQGVLTTTADAVVNGVNIGRGGGAISTNTRVGVNALANNTTGANNTANGRNALQNNTTGSGNTANGLDTLINNTEGTGNTSNGFQVLLSNTTGDSNTAIGREALRSNITGSNNSAIGRNSGRFIADGATANTITNNSVFLGVDTRAASDNQTNQIVIGHTAIGLGSNTTVIGNSSTTFGRWYGSLLLGTTTNAASSILTMESTTRGFLPPRMTSTQRNAIASPATGLIVYDTTLNDPFYFNGTAWTMLQDTITLTTTGSSGAATLVGTTLNIPNYGSALSGYLPLTGGTLTGPLSVTGNITLIAGGSGSSFNREISLGSGTAYNYQVRANDDDFQLKEAGSHVFLAYTYGGSLGTGTIRLYNNTVSTASFTGTSFIRSGGTSSQFLKADGSVDSNTYVTGGPFLPLTGGTLTGALNGTSATFTGDIRSNGIYRDYQGEALIETNTSAITQIGSSGASTGRSLSFFAGNTLRMFITTNGNVGINSSTVNERLVVTQTTNNTSSVGFYTSASTGTSFGPIIQAGTNSSDASLRVFNQGGTSPYLFVRGDGNVGIGTDSPNARLHILNSLGGTTPSNYLQIEGSISDNSNYPSILFKGGTLVTTYPNISLTNGGLGLTLNQGFSSSFPNSSQISLNNGTITLSTGTSPSARFSINSSGGVILNSLSGSGNRIVVANSAGTLISAVIGSGLAFDGTTLTATGGGSGSISGSGTSGIIALFTGSTSIGNSAISQSGSNITVTGDIRSNAIYRDYQGEALIQTSGSDTQIGTFGAGTPRTISLLAGNDRRLFITTGGRVLIGTTSDNGALFRILGPNGVGTFFDAQNDGAAGATFARIGNSFPFNQYTFANGNVIVGGSVTATSFFESSDATLKTLVQDDYQAKGIDSVVAKLYIKNGKKELGYFAQDLEGVLPSAVNKGSDGLLNLSYREVHTAKIAYLEEEIRQIKKRYEIN
jgi:hypothetical protein